MRITVLGSGTSIGVPYINCTCEVCTSTNPKDKRLRASILIDVEGQHILIDCGPDFRQQILAHPVPKIDAVLITHEHYDHVGGMDDLRPFKGVPIYAEHHVINAIVRNMPYCFGQRTYPGVPQMTVHTINSEPFTLNGLEIIPIRCMHAKLPILGFRIHNFAYITDISSIEDKELEKLQNIEVLIVDALRIQPHFSHFNLEQAQAFSKKIGAKTTYFTHISHQLGLHDVVEAALPANQHLCYDGLVIEI